MRKVIALMLSVVASSLFASMAIITPASATQPGELMIIQSTPLSVDGPYFEPLPSGLVKSTLSVVQDWTGDWVGTNRHARARGMVM